MPEDRLEKMLRGLFETILRSQIYMMYTLLNVPTIPLSTEQRGNLEYNLSESTRVLDEIVRQR